MAGNSQRRGAVRKSSKKPKVGSGGQSRRALEGRGPTPKAEDRTYHPAGKRKLQAERAAEQERRHARGRAGARGGRRSDAGEVVAGRNAVLEALRAAVPVSAISIALRIDVDDRIREILELATAASIPVAEVNKVQLDHLSDGAVHQGVVATVPPYEYADVDELLDAADASGTDPLLVALDGVTDPRNLGAVLRSAGAFGAHGVIVPERRAAGVTVAAWRVSAGAAARVPVAHATNLVRALEDLKKAGVFVVGLDGGGDTAIGELPFANDPVVLVVGSEGKLSLIHI